MLPHFVICFFLYKYTNAGQLRLILNSPAFLLIFIFYYLGILVTLTVHVIVLLCVTAVTVVVPAFLAITCPLELIVQTLGLLLRHTILSSVSVPRTSSQYESYCSSVIYDLLSPKAWTVHVDDTPFAVLSHTTSAVPGPTVVITPSSLTVTIPVSVEYHPYESVFVAGLTLTAVSYTHLTLPTKLEV